MITYNKIKNRIFSAILRVLLSCVIALLFLPIPGQFVKADTVNDYSILDDFAGTKLDILKYPENPFDYSLDVVQLAEAQNGSIIVYVYQPSAGRNNVIATSINISRTEDGSDRENYELEILGSYKTLSKYKVKGMLVSSAPTRLYDISTIYRAFNSVIDTLPDDAYRVDEIAFTVGQQWTAITIDGNVSYNMKETSVIEITDRYDGYIRYASDWNLKPNLLDTVVAVDRHYIAFSTEYDFDDIQSIDISYGAYEYESMLDLELVGFDPHLDAEYYDKVHIDKDDEFWIKTFFYEDYSWQGIQTTEEFLAAEKVRDDVVDKISNKQWVLNYLVTDFKCPPIWIGTSLKIPCKHTYVTEVTMLQITFELDSETYSLGVVDDKRTGSPYPVNWKTPVAHKSPWDYIADFFKSVWNFFKNSFNGNWWVWLIILAVLVLIPVLCALFPVVFQAVLAVFKGLWWLVCLPFKGIAALVRKIKKE